jgi:phosphomannomutase
LLKGAKVGVYEHSGVARDLLPELLTALGADVVRLGRSEQFIPVDTEAIRPEDIALAKEWSNEYKLDAVVSTDGDADRPLISDENGTWLRGDVAGVLTARFLNADKVVTPVSSNSVVERCGEFSSVIRTRIGSPYVIEGMQKAMDTASVTVVGYEANGGFLQATPVSIGDSALLPLPTRDAVIVIISILAMSRKLGIPVSGLVAALPNRYTHSDRLKEFPVDKSKKMISSMASGDFTADATSFMNIFGSDLGEVEQIDYTDGVRFTLSSGEVVHLRPSGNAPELRCYTEAGTVSRAVELNRASLKAVKLQAV